MKIDWKKKLKNMYFVGQYPDTDWQRLLVLFIVIGLFMALWSFYNYYQIRNEVFNVDSASGSARIEAANKQKELQVVIDRYQAKEQKFRSLLPSQAIVPQSNATTTGDR